MSGYSVSPQALADLFEIWQYIAQDNEEAADRVQGEFYQAFSSLAQTPGQGHSRKDLTRRQVLFFPLYSYESGAGALARLPTPSSALRRVQGDPRGPGGPPYSTHPPNRTVRPGYSAL